MTPPTHVDLGPPRVVELFGPSSTGKSSLAARLVSGEAGPGFILAGDRVLASAGLGWLPGRLLRTVALDLIALGALVASWRQQRAFYALAAAQALHGPGPSGWLLRLNLLRNSWKCGALRFVAGRLGRPHQVLLMDEGPLQTANYLFVHVDPPPDRAGLDAFLAAVPLPDAALYLRESEEELVARTLARTHPRVASHSPAETRRFVSHALAVFDRIAEDRRVRERLLTPEALFGCMRGRAAEVRA